MRASSRRWSNSSVSRFLNMATPILGGWAAPSLAQAWATLVSNMSARLLVQGPLASFFPDVRYDFLKDSFIGPSDFTNDIALVAAGAPSNKTDAIVFWHQIDSTMQAISGSSETPIANYDSALSAAM